MFESKTPKAFCQRLAGHLEANDVLEAFKLHNQNPRLSAANKTL